MAITIKQLLEKINIILSTVAETRAATNEQENILIVNTRAFAEEINGRTSPFKHLSTTDKAILAKELSDFIWPLLKAEFSKSPKRYEIVEEVRGILAFTVPGTKNIVRKLRDRTGEVFKHLPSIPKSNKVLNASTIGTLFPNEGGRTFDFGHLFGGGARVSQRAIDTIIEERDLIPTEFKTLVGFLTEVLEIDVNKEFEKTIRQGSLVAVTVLTLEPHRDNQKDGNRIGVLITKAKNEIKKLLIKEAAGLISSPSIQKEIQQLIVRRLMGKKTQKKTKATRKTTLRLQQRIQKLRLKYSPRVKIVNDTQDQGRISKKIATAKGLQYQLNRKMRKNLQATMGKGFAVKMLNYRTGRFAKSVIILDLQQINKRDFIAHTSYLFDPYRRAFAAGKFLNRGFIGREPREIIRKGIRKSLKELRLGRLRVGVQVDGE